MNTINSYWQHMGIKSLKSHDCSPDGYRSWRVSSEELNSYVQSDMDKAGAGKKYEM